MPSDGRRTSRGTHTVIGEPDRESFFYVDCVQRMILLHGIIKKTMATPPNDLELARNNKRKHEKAFE